MIIGIHWVFTITVPHENKWKWKVGMGVGGNETQWDDNNALFTSKHTYQMSHWHQVSLKMSRRNSYYSVHKTWIITLKFNCQVKGTHYSFPITLLHRLEPGSSTKTITLKHKDLECGPQSNVRVMPHSITLLNRLDLRPSSIRDSLHCLLVNLL